MPAIDYAQELRDSIQTTRDALITTQHTVDAGKDTALSALDISRRNYLDSLAELTDGHAALVVGEQIDRKAVEAKLMADNAVALATNANVEAIATTAAMAAAAAGIKAAAAAIDVVTKDIHGIAGITDSNDKDDHLNHAALRAQRAIAAVANAVEYLKTRSLDANIEAARPRTAPALQCAQGIQQDVASVLAASTTTLNQANTFVTAARTERSTSLTDLTLKSELFTVAERDDTALVSAIQTIDSVTNASLVAVVDNTPEKAGDPARPGLRATAVLTPPVAEGTETLRFFAVPTRSASSFDLEAANLVPAHGFVDAKIPAHRGAGQATAPAPVEIQAHLLKDSDGHTIKEGESYSVFFLRLHKDKVAAGAGDLSFPALPVVSTVMLAFPSGPTVFLFPNRAFVVVAPATDHINFVQQYRLILTPSDAYDATPGAELFLANALSATSFSALDPTRQSARQAPKTIVAALKEEYIHEMKPFGRVQPQGLDEVLDKIEAHLKANKDVSVYVVYFSPFSTKAGWQKEFTIATYTDIYGDVIALETRTYRAFAAADGATKIDPVFGELKRAANVISGPSDVFPATLQTAAAAETAEESDDKTGTRKSTKK